LTNKSGVLELAPAFESAIPAYAGISRTPQAEMILAFTLVQTGQECPAYDYQNYIGTFAFAFDANNFIFFRGVHAGISAPWINAQTRNKHR